MRWQLVAENVTDVGAMVHAMAATSPHGAPSVTTTSVIVEGLAAARGAGGRRIARHFLAALGLATAAAPSSKSAVLASAWEAVLGDGSGSGGGGQVTTLEPLLPLPRARRSNVHRLLLLCAADADAATARGVINDLEGGAGVGASAKGGAQLPDREMYVVWAREAKPPPP